MLKWLFFAVFCFVLSNFSFTQAECFAKMEKAFSERGAYEVSDAMHKNVAICFFSKDRIGCYHGKVRVEGGKITSVFLQFSDDTYLLLEEQFYNSSKKPPVIKNGISEMIFTAKGESFKVVFMDQLKPKDSGQLGGQLDFSSVNKALLVNENAVDFDLTIRCSNIQTFNLMKIVNKNCIFTTLSELKKAFVLRENLG